MNLHYLIAGGCIIWSSLVCGENSTEVLPLVTIQVDKLTAGAQKFIECADPERVSPEIIKIGTKSLFVLPETKLAPAEVIKVAKLIVKRSNHNQKITADNITKVWSAWVDEENTLPLFLTDPIVINNWSVAKITKLEFEGWGIRMLKVSNYKDANGSWRTVEVNDYSVSFSKKFVPTYIGCTNTYSETVEADE